MVERRAYILDASVRFPHNCFHVTSVFEEKLLTLVLRVDSVKQSYVQKGDYTNCATAEDHFMTLKKPTVGG